MPEKRRKFDALPDHPSGCALDPALGATQLCAIKRTERPSHERYAGQSDRRATGATSSGASFRTRRNSHRSPASPTDRRLLERDAGLGAV
jgi:hypothetical protein